MFRMTAVLLAVAAIAADRPEMTPKRTDVKPFDYIPADVPFYPPGEKWGTIGATIKRMQKPLDPAESMKHYVHPANLELRLFADESLLGGKPIAMTWDERGRCWVAVTVDYPNNLQPEGQGHDRILILEDTKGTGRADKVTVFADKLSIPTSLVIARGGVIVTQAPHTLFLRSTHGDDHADGAQFSSPAGAPATRTPGRAICVMARMTGSTASAATPASTAPSAACNTGFNRVFTASGPTARPSNF